MSCFVNYYVRFFLSWLKLVIGLFFEGKVFIFVLVFRYSLINLLFKVWAVASHFCSWRFFLFIFLLFFSHHRVWLNYFSASPSTFRFILALASGTLNFASWGLRLELIVHVATSYYLFQIFICTFSWVGSWLANLGCYFMYPNVEIFLVVLCVRKYFITHEFPLKVWIGTLVNLNLICKICLNFLNQL